METIAKACFVFIAAAVIFIASRAKTPRLSPPARCPSLPARCPAPLRTRLPASSAERARSVHKHTYVTPHTSHLTPHTSHLTPHTSHHKNAPHSPSHEEFPLASHAPNRSCNKAFQQHFTRRAHCLVPHVVQLAESRRIFLLLLPLLSRRLAPGHVVDHLRGRRARGG
jgi:hypothetical protein